MRKRMDSATDTQEEAESVALECMDDIAEISSGKCKMSGAVQDGSHTV